MAKPAPIEQRTPNKATQQRMDEIIGYLTARTASTTEVARFIGCKPWQAYHALRYLEIQGKVTSYTSGMHVIWAYANAPLSSPVTLAVQDLNITKPKDRCPPKAEVKSDLVTCLRKALIDASDALAVAENIAIALSDENLKLRNQVARAKAAFAEED